MIIKNGNTDDADKMDFHRDGNTFYIKIFKRFFSGNPLNPYYPRFYNSKLCLAALYAGNHDARKAITMAVMPTNTKSVATIFTGK